MHERRLRAMGVDCHVVLNGDAELLDIAEQRIAALDRCWSRFDESSEISQLNAQPGRWVPVSGDLADLCRFAVRGWRATGGLFDPFMLTSIVEAGYDRDFDELVAADATPPTPREIASKPVETRRRWQEAPLELRTAQGRGDFVRLVAGAGIDSGGIGKGLGADLVTRSLMGAGASGALVSLGGDIRVRGASERGAWIVDVDDPDSDDAPTVATLTLRGGSVCTSSWLGRRWDNHDGTTAHHLLDPRTGKPATPTMKSVSVIASTGWRAESLSKAVFLSSPRAASRLLRRYRAGAVVVTLDGDVLQV